MFHMDISIDGKTVSEHSPVYIIAEAGVNHNGDMNLAKEMIDVAAEAGVDAVKFQNFKADGLILKNIEKITFLSTPFEKASLEELDNLGVPAFKVAATDLTNIQFLRQVAEKGKPIILSAGMCYLEEVKRALNAIYPLNKEVILLQCTANYPIQNSEANINVIRTLRDEFHILVGYSDHSQGVGAAPFAVAAGAKLVEKHFTLDKNMEGPDHKASVTPGELKQLVEDIRRVEEYLGDGVKMPSCSEQMTRKSLQKCLVAGKDIKAGEKFCNENIVAKRTDGVGISALYFDEIVGRTAGKDFTADEIIRVD